MTHMMRKVRMCQPNILGNLMSHLILAVLTPKGVVFAVLNVIHSYSSGQDGDATVDVQELHALTAADVHLNVDVNRVNNF